MAFYYARADATSDSNPGTGNTIATAKKTVAALCGLLGPGDTGYLMDDGGKFLVTSEHDIELIGASGNVATLAPYPGDTPIISALGATMGSTDAIVSIDAGSEYFHITQIIFEDNDGGRGLELSSAVSPSKVQHGTIEGCTIRRVAERGVGGGGDNITLDNLTVFDFCMSNEEEALGGGGGWASGIATFTYSNGTFPYGWTLKNSTIGPGWGEAVIALRSGDISAAQSGWVIEYNTIRLGYSKLCYIDKSQGVTVRFNNFVVDSDDYNKNGHRADAVTFSGEGSPLHGDTHEVDTIYIYGNWMKGCRKGTSWFQDTNAVGNTWRNVYIWYNSMYGLTGNAFDFPAVAALAAAPTTLVARNNICDGGIGTLANAAACTFSHNCWIDGIPSLGTHTNSIHADPIYVDPGTAVDDVLTIFETSPCLLAGTPVSSPISVTTDYFNVTRHVSTPTIGAVEEGTESVGGTPPGILAYTTTFQTGTGALGSTFDVTGASYAGTPWTPKAAIFLWSGRTETSETGSSKNIARGIGFVDQDLNVRANTTISIDGVNPTDTAERHTNVACVSILINSTTRDGELKVNSFISGGIKMEAITTQFTNSYTVQVLMLGGAALTNTAVNHYAASTSLGGQGLSNLGFQPDAILIASTGSTSAFPSTGVDSRLTIGAATGASNEATWTGGGNDNTTPAATLAYCKSDEFISALNSGIASTTLRAEFTAFQEGGFLTNFTEVSGSASQIIFLALKGGRVKVGNFTPPDNNTYNVDLGFTPAGMMFISANRAESTADTATAPDYLSAGFMSGPVINQNVSASWDENGGAASDCNSAIAFDAATMIITDAGAVSVKGAVIEIHPTSIDIGPLEDKFTWYFAIGNDEEVEPPPDPEPVTGHPKFIFIW